MNSLVYLKLKKSDQYFYEEDYTYLIGPVIKTEAKPMTKNCAKSIIAKNPDLEMEEVK